MLNILISYVLPLLILLAVFTIGKGLQYFLISRIDNELKKLDEERIKIQRFICLHTYKK